MRRPHDTGTVLALAAMVLVLPGRTFGASPAPKPSAGDVEAWGRIVDSVFPTEKLKERSALTGLSLTGLAALREGKPALCEAIFRRVFAAAPEYEANYGDAWLRGAMELAKDPVRRAEKASFILLYLDVAEARKSEQAAARVDEVRKLRAELAAVKSPPAAPEAPSLQGLRDVVGAGEISARTEVTRGRYLRTVGDLRTIGVAFEAYAVDNSLYPSGGLEEIEKKLSPAYVRHFPRLDGWETPLRLETSRDRRHYRLVSAGADGKFETLPPLGDAKKAAKRTVDDASRDILFEDGELVQEWSEGAFAAAPEASRAAPALNADSVAQRAAHRDTMASMRNLATALESYNIDKDEFPSGWLESIESVLVPKYVQTFPRVDAWGTPFRISSGGKRKHYRIVSAGTDRVFEPIPYLDAGSRPAPRKDSDPERDLVFEDGDFVQTLDMNRPPATLPPGKARPAPEPTTSEVDSWRPLLDASFPSERSPGSQTLIDLGSLLGEARAACLPSLAEAILRRAYGQKPAARRGTARVTFAEAWALLHDETRWSETAPFILTYLEEAERLRSMEILDRQDVVAIARARLMAVDTTPRLQAPPSVELLAKLRAAGEARRAASEKRSADYKKTRNDMFAVGNALKAYHAREGRYPGGTWPPIRKILRASATGDLVKTDAWGTDFRYEGSVNGSMYRFSSAGSDRRFEDLPPIEASFAKVPFESDDPAGDIVMATGAWLREWSGIALFLPSPDPAPSPEDPARYAHGRTLAVIRRIGDALDTYRNDYGTYPEVGNRLADWKLPGVYISEVPTRDAWGRELVVRWTSDRKHFRIVSAGADREFENQGEIDPAAAWGRTSLSTDPKRDIVFQDGIFLQAYRDAR